jgi:hypothetical protein
VLYFSAKAWMAISVFSGVGIAGVVILWVSPDSSDLRFLPRTSVSRGNVTDAGNILRSAFRCAGRFPFVGISFTQFVVRHRNTTAVQEEMGIYGIARPWSRKKAF